MLWLLLLPLLLLLLLLVVDGCWLLAVECRALVSAVAVVCLAAVQSTSVVEEQLQSSSAQQTEAMAHYLSPNDPQMSVLRNRTSCADLEKALGTTIGLAERRLLVEKAVSTFQSHCWCSKSWCSASSSSQSWC